MRRVTQFCSGSACVLDHSEWVGYILVILERSDHSLKILAHFSLSHCAATGKGHICIPFYDGEQIQKTVTDH